MGQRERERERERERGCVRLVTVLLRKECVVKKAHRHKLCYDYYYDDGFDELRCNVAFCTSVVLQLLFLRMISVLF